ncbi:MAG: hypothetical protein HYV24_03365 [Deltaproteobacteria bacterium]|nr:hypothetical protein [Deltaproteobacteria bacterium]
MRFLLLALILAVATGCAITQKDNHEAAYGVWETAMKTYAECMIITAKTYSESEATAFEIAEAAQSKCGQQFYTLERATLDYYLSNARGSYGRNLAIEASERQIQKIKSDGKDTVVQEVIEYRLQKNPRPMPKVVQE